MKAIRRFLADTADLVFELLRVLGLSGPRWEFRKQALRRRLTGASADLENLRRGVRAEHKMCRECRILMPANARRCPECGASTRGIPRGGLGRLLGLLFPSFASVTSIIVVLNFACYLVSVVIAPGQTRPDLLGIPGPGNYSLWMLGAKAALPVLTEYHQLYRLVMPTLLHGGLMHILFNTYALMNLGPLVEHLAGRRRFVVLYLASGIAAFLASTLLTPSLSVGASGSLFGLLGFLIVFGRVSGGAAGRALSAHLMRWIFLAVIISLAPGIDFWAHAGGFAAGAAFGALYRPGISRSAVRERFLNGALVVSLLVVVFSMAAVVLDWPRNQGVWLGLGG